VVAAVVVVADVVAVAGLIAGNARLLNGNREIQERQRLFAAISGRSFLPERTIVC